jgi:hypothetical protein
MVRLKLPRIDFKKYRQPRALMACYDLWGKGVAFRGQRFKREACPLCCKPGRGDRCFSWDFASCSFYCHKCGAKGDALELVKRMLCVNIIQAAKWLEAKLGPTGSGLV